MKLIKWASALLLVAILIEAAWCLLLLYGNVDAPSDVGAVLHDTFYTRASAMHFTKMAVFVLAGALVGLWAAREKYWPNPLLKSAGWLAVIGAAATFTAINWMFIKPLIINDMPRRMPDKDEWDAMQSLATFMYRAMLVGNFGIVLSFVLLFVGVLKQRQGKEKI